VTRRPLSILIIAAGVLMELAGLVVDAALHAGDASLSSEGLVSLGNPGHVLMGAGLVLLVTGVVLVLVDAPARGARYLTRHVLPAFVLVAFAAAAGAYVIATDEAHSDAHSHASGDSAATDADMEALRAGLSPEVAALVIESRHDHAAEVPVSESDLRLLNDQLATVRAAVVKYESIGAAIDDGYVQVTQDLPLIGAHFLKPAYAEDPGFEPGEPEMLIYHHEDGAWRLYGVSYITSLAAPADEVAPEGFAGPLDTWHWHSDWCFTVGGARSATAAECEKLAGFHVARMGYQMHLWLVDNPTGVFSHSHPGLTGSAEGMFDVPKLLAVLRLAVAGSGQ
jgi:hypothetical protein